MLLANVFKVSHVAAQKKVKLVNDCCYIIMSLFTLDTAI